MNKLKNILDGLENLPKNRPALVILSLVIAIFLCALVFTGTKVAFLVLGLILTIILIVTGIGISNRPHRY